MLNGGFYFMFCLAKVLFCSSAEVQAVAVLGLQYYRSLSIDTNKIFVLISDLVGFYLTSPAVEYLGRWGWHQQLGDVWHQGLVCVGDLRPRAGGGCLRQSQDSPSVQEAQAVCAQWSPGSSWCSTAPSAVGLATGGNLRRWGKRVLGVRSWAGINWRSPQDHRVLCGFTRGPLWEWLLWFFGPRVWLQPNPGCGLEPSWALIPWRTLVAGLKVSIWCISWQCASYGPFTAPWLQFWIWDVHAWRGGWWRTRTTLSHPGHCTSVTVIYSWDPVSVLKDLFFRINITLWFLISTLWNFLFHNAQTAFKFSV